MLSLLLLSTLVSSPIPPQPSTVTEPPTLDFSAEGGQARVEESIQKLQADLQWRTLAQNERDWRNALFSPLQQYVPSRFMGIDSRTVDPYLPLRRCEMTIEELEQAIAQAVQATPADRAQWYTVCMYLRRLLEESGLRIHVMRTLAYQLHIFAAEVLLKMRTYLTAPYHITPEMRGTIHTFTAGTTEQDLSDKGRPPYEVAEKKVVLNLIENYEKRSAAKGRQLSALISRCPSIAQAIPEIEAFYRAQATIEAFKRWLS